MTPLIIRRRRLGVEEGLVSLSSQPQSGTYLQFAACATLANTPAVESAWLQEPFGVV
jgi:hypothetical protein